MLYPSTHCISNNYYPILKKRTPLDLFNSDFASFHEACQPPRGENYSPHIYDAQTPKTPCSKLPHSTSVRFADLEEADEATSDYASIEARSPGDPLAEDDWPKPKKSSLRNSITSQVKLRISFFIFFFNIEIIANNEFLLSTESTRESVRLLQSKLSRPR